jgi:hypothetical protein
MPSIDDVVAQILKTGAPVLFVDTCILLDIIRSTNRGLRDYAERATELLKLITATQPGCLMVVSSIIPHEWKANAQEVTNEVVRQIAKMDEQSSHFHDACEALGISVGFDRASYAGSGLAGRLHDLSLQLLDNSVCLDADDPSRLRAFGRVVANIPPSRKSGEVKDCAIIEEYLAVCRGLQAAGFAKKRVFCTSNTDDYCDPGKKLHANLAVEFSNVGLVFSTNLNWAMHEVSH